MRLLISIVLGVILFGIITGCATNSIQLDNYQIIRKNYFDSSKYQLNKSDTNRVNAWIFNQIVNQFSTDSFLVVRISAQNMGYEEYGGFDFLSKVFFIATPNSFKPKEISDTVNSTFESIKITSRYLSNPIRITGEAIAPDSTSKYRFDFASVDLSIIKIDHVKKSILIDAYHW